MMFLVLSLLSTTSLVQVVPVSVSFHQQNQNKIKLPLCIIYVMKDMETRWIWAQEEEMDAIGSGSSPLMGFGISSAEPLGFIMRELVMNKMQTSNN